MKRIKYFIAFLKKKFFFGGLKGLGLGDYPKVPYWKIVKGGQSGEGVWFGLLVVHFIRL